ncbi:probable palmitoyltransferase ZDHHC19 [Gopherus evgoodei]|uniref:probable palmitoyltransferase ZDHHC19 n=1 Tax=Gopherus evgoodei TaxID=1825980 RepID=UPI0011CF4946|nr:probable palmitoyltransferase ZDHHC19 [Gopherus evgoodei]
MIPARAVPRWVLPSLFASFHFSSLLALSSLFFSFPCTKSLLAVGYHLLLSFHFRCSWLAIHVSLAFPLVAGILFIPAVANLLLASFTDPGILHRGNRSMAQAPEGRDRRGCVDVRGQPGSAKAQEPTQPGQRQCQHPTRSSQGLMQGPCSLVLHHQPCFELPAQLLLRLVPGQALSLGVQSHPPRCLPEPGAEGRARLVIQALRVKERRFDLHWCQKCQYYCPPRTFHCPWCNVCVEEFDHHCKWLNNCIGCRNFRFFFLFVAFLCSYNVVVLASCITYLALNSHQAYGAEKICAILVTIPAALYLLPLLILVGSQASFITLAKHTYELKPREEGRANPFDLGWARNWYAALCAPQGPKYMVRAAEPKAATRRGRKVSVAQLLPPMSCLNTASPGLSSHRCLQDLPGQGRAAQVGAKGTWWPASPERKMNVAMTGEQNLPDCSPFSPSVAPSEPCFPLVFTLGLHTHAQSPGVKSPPHPSPKSMAKLPLTSVGTRISKHFTKEGSIFIPTVQQGN